MQPHIQAINIQAMMAEIEGMMLETGVDFENKIHRSYITAQLELNSPDANLAYVHNLLAAALNRPKATRH